MKHDPFYQQILDRLARPLDPDDFERCAADILRVDFPTLVPIRGGTDSGMDGAVGDGKGEPFPLITTTGEDVIGNLTGNLATYLKSGGPRRKMLLATTQELTPKRRSNLQERARLKGCRLVQIYERAAIADRLYRRPEWCRDLLGLTGTPPALSEVPLMTKPLVGSQVFGREDDLKWLEALKSDAVLAGQPGCGKTFLMFAFARANAARFVVSTDRTDIATSLRDQDPRVLIVDDAHLHLDLLTSLQQMRRELGVPFVIITCCWPGQHEAVQQVLSVPDSRVRTLELLTRDEMVQVINAAGVFGPDDLVEDIVNQAEGRPGLAVTLAYLCLQGGVRDVVFGNALSRSIRTTFEPLVGKEVTDLLAAFAVGGANGMRMDVVGRYLDLSVPRVRRMTAELATGGVISEVSGEAISVRPDALREVLVRDVFFTGATSLNILPLLSEAGNLAGSARTLIGAVRRGANVPNELLLPLLEALRQPKLWAAFAALGAEETDITLEAHPEFIKDYSEVALHYRPKKTLPLLFRAAIGDNRGLPQHSSHPLRRVQDWVQSGRPGTEAALRHRRTVVQSSGDWLRTGGDVQVGVHALTIGLDPRFETMRADPGSGHTITITRGTITAEDVEQFASIWTTALEIIRGLSGEIPWHLVLDAVEDWVYVDRLTHREPPPELREAMGRQARLMISDIAPLISERPGLMDNLANLASRVGVTVEVPQDAEYTTLFPRPDRRNWRDNQEMERKAVTKLADSWAHRPPQEAAKRLQELERRAEEAGATWPRWTPALCEDIAIDLPNPTDWVVALSEVKAAPDLILPFIRRIVVARVSGWERVIDSLLNEENYQFVTIAVLIEAPDLPSPVLGQALALLNERHAKMVERLCQMSTLPVDTVLSLLQHGNEQIATAAAIGLWLADPKRNTAEQLVLAWRHAVANSIDDGYWIGEILESDTSLATEWIQGWFSETDGREYDVPDWFATVCRKLSKAERSILLKLAPSRAYWLEDAVVALVNGEIDLYAEVLQLQSLDRVHLSLLSEMNDESLRSMIPLALQAGHSKEEIADSLIPGNQSWSGEESSMWQGWVNRFSLLEADVDSRIREIARIARGYVEQCRDRAAQRERHSAVHGDD